jgi:hypothetical protein
MSKVAIQQIGMGIFCTALSACAEPEDEGSDVEVRLDESHAAVTLANGNIISFKVVESGDVDVHEHGRVPNPAVLNQPELLNATPAEVFWAIADNDAGMPQFLAKNHDLLSKVEPREDLALVMLSDAGWLRTEIDDEVTWRAAADCVNATFTGVNCLPEAGYTDDVCVTNGNPSVADDVLIVKYRAAVCGESTFEYVDKLQYWNQRQEIAACAIDAPTNWVWNEYISEDEYNLHTWTSTGGFHPYRRYRHGHQGVVPGVSVDWSSMWDQADACEA